LNLLTSATDKIRSVFVDKKAERKVERVLDRASSAENAEAAEGTESAEDTEDAGRPRSHGRPSTVRTAAHFAPKPAAEKDTADDKSALDGLDDSADEDPIEPAGTRPTHPAKSAEPAFAASADVAQQASTPVAERFAQPYPVLEQISQSIEQQVAQTAQTPAASVPSDLEPAAELIPELVFNAESKSEPELVATSKPTPKSEPKPESASKAEPQSEPKPAARHRVNVKPPTSAASSPPPTFANGKRSTRSPRRSANSYATESSTIFFS
jgi:hypothetical protein